MTGYEQACPKVIRLSDHQGKIEMPDGSKSLRSSSTDVPTFHHRIFGRIGTLMAKAADQILIPGVNAYNMGQYEEALGYFEASITNTPAMGQELYPHLIICRRVTGTEKTSDDLRFEQERDKWLNTSSLFKWAVTKPSPKIRCKYCGHYTFYIDSLQGLAYLGTNNCQLCRRGYPTPEFVWDSLDGQAYIYYRRSVREDTFYQEFEQIFDVEEPFKG